VAPKNPDPVIVITVPSGPEVGLSELMTTRAEATALPATNKHTASAAPAIGERN
jgi:hypothetical protein